MKKDRIHIYEMESYKHASEEQRNSMRICKIRYFDLEGLPSKEVKEILEAFIWERGKTLALSSLATELTTYRSFETDDTCCVGRRRKCYGSSLSFGWKKSSTGKKCR